jgi:hypothetical protein
MAFPNSVIDPVPGVFGWPWHGLIEGDSEFGSGGVLTVPSGRAFPMAPTTQGENWTYLWDIGQPPVAVDTVDPDEQWLPVAILRSRPRDSRAKAYGGIDAGRPTKMLGATASVIVTPRYSGDLSAPDRGNVYVRLEAVINLGGGPLVADVSVLKSIDFFGFSDIPEYLDISLVDVSHDGRKRLFLISELLVGGVLASAAFFEVSIVGDLPLITGEITVIASRPQATGMYSGLLTPDVITTYIYRASSDSGISQTNSPLAWNQSGYPFLIRTVRHGQHTSAVTVTLTAWAWYGVSGAVELLIYKAHAMETLARSFTLSGDNISAIYNSQITYNLELSSPSGVITMRVDSVRNSTQSGGVGWIEGFDVSTTQENKIDGVQVASYSAASHTPGDIDMSSLGSDPIVDQSVSVYRNYIYFYGGIEQYGYQDLFAVKMLSNKLAALSVTLYRGVPSSANYPAGDKGEHYVGAALTPHGVSDGAYSINANTATELEYSRWNKGAYNPVTGLVVRNQTDKFRTWV